jgi:Kef-type K+ transport system membrane component KefB
VSDASLLRRSRAVPIALVVACAFTLAWAQPATGPDAGAGTQRPAPSWPDAGSPRDGTRGSDAVIWPGPPRQADATVPRPDARGLDAASWPAPPGRPDATVRADVRALDAASGEAAPLGDAGPARLPPSSRARGDAGTRSPRRDAGASTLATDARIGHASASVDPMAVTDESLDTLALDDAGVAETGDATDDASDDAGVDAIGEQIPVEAGPATSEAVQTVAEQERTVDAPVVETPPEGPPASRETTVFALKVIFGLAVLLVLAYLGGHPRTLRLQERLGLRGVILAGFPFVALGVVASLPAVGILTDDVIPKLRPVLQFGLGWIGFIIGAQLDIRVLNRVPRGSAYLILVEAIAPFAVTALACGAVMIGVFGLSLDDVAAWRDIVLLGAAAAMTAPRRFHGFANRTWFEGRGADALLGQLDEIVGVVGLLFIMAYFRDDTTSAWQLPRTAWLFVTVGLGVLIGVVIFATIRLPRSSAEFLAVLLGAIAFATGFAAVLRVSPVVICFIAGTLVTNFPNEQRENVFAILNRLERPIHILFLMIVGALWSVIDWRGWALVPLFVACRIAGKWLGITLMRASAGSLLPAELTENRRLLLPMSTLAIALVVSLERFRDIGLNWVVTAVIGGSLVTELLISLKEQDNDEEPPPLQRRHTGPIDELDDDEPSRAPIESRPPADEGPP